MPAVGALTRAAKAAKPRARPAAPNLRPSGENLFDLSKLDQVPDVPQTPMERYVPMHGPSERVADLFANKSVRKKVEGVVDAGAAEGGAKWYNTDPLMAAFVDALDWNDGMAAYRRYMEMVAATSPRSRVPDNIRNASYYYGLDRQGADLPDLDNIPRPYGHLAQSNHQDNVRTVIDNNGWDVLKNPKPASFAANLAGNQVPVTVDAHALKLPALLAKDPRWLATSMRIGKPGAYTTLRPQKMLADGEITLKGALSRPALWDSKPREREYGTMEELYTEIGEKKGMTPAQTQASAWIGGRGITGMDSPPAPFMELFQQKIIDTARKRGENPLDTLQKFISGEAPLLAKGGQVKRPPGLFKKGGRVGGALAYQRGC